MLTIGKIVLRSLRFHARSHLGTFLGVAVASAVLIGALAVGDSVRQSLRDMQLARLGKVDFALASQDRFFGENFGGSYSNAAPVLLLRGTAANADGTARANRVQVLGVDARFWALAENLPSWAATNTDAIVLNESLAQQLQVHPGDTVLLRMQKPSALPIETPLAVQEGNSLAARWIVAAIVSDAEFGRFGLQANQVPPFNAFLPLPQLQAKLALSGKANLLLLKSSEAATNLNASLRQHFSLADAQMRLRACDEGLELVADRIFLDPPVVEAARKAAPEVQLLSTYFVNELRAGPLSTPYSTLTAMGLPTVPGDMRDDEILINDWLAEDLQTKPGETLSVKYFTLGQTRRLEEKQDHFKIRAVIPLNPADRSLMPEFPGLAKAEKTENWDAGFPLEMDKIRPKDEQYWKEHRGTPKAFITLKAGQKMWGNRFGEVTALRFPSETNASALESRLLQHLDPATLGFSFQPVRQQALAASSQAQDFGELFLYFSFFLILAALLLVALLFQFGLETRATETGVFLALGFRPRQVRQLLLMEGLVVAILGVIPGVFGGLLYAKGILYALRTIWRAAVGTSALQFHVSPETIAIGSLASLLVSLAVIWMALRNQAKRSARELLEQGAELETVDSPKRRWAGWVAVVSACAALGLIGSALWHRDTSNSEAFFGSGALLLIAGISVVAVWLRKLAEARSTGFTLTSLAVRGCARRRRRSLATIALLASGVFLIVAVQANKLEATKNGPQRSSGTGGFAYLGETALPVVQDLNSPAGRDFYGLDPLPGVEVVPLRVRDGDEASCLNLNRAQNPRLLGVNPELLDSRNAFTFAAIVGTNSNPWLLLKAPQADGAIPAVADDAVIKWALGKNLGDTLPYTDEKGNTLKIRLVGALANSILQGSLVIDEAQFVKHFPGESGYREFLIDAPETASVAPKFSRALQDVGLEMTSATQRLDAFNAVQNTYLGTFQLLGGLGLLLGSVGLGAVVLRNVLERRSESAVLIATGFKPGSVRRLVLGEHTILLGLGLGLGMGAALIAVLPTVASSTSQVSWTLLALTLGVILLNGLFWAWLAVRIALRGELLGALRNE